MALDSLHFIWHNPGQSTLRTADEINCSLTAQLTRSTAFSRWSTQLALLLELFYASGLFDMAPSFEQHLALILSAHTPGCNLVSTMCKLSAFRAR